MYGWVSASTSGLTRSEIGARLPIRAATRSIACELAAWLSTLNARMPPLERVLDLVLALADAARRRSSSGSAPTLSARKISPRETMSTPAPSATSARSTARFELAFTE